jgi:hypothetical protein
MKQNSGRFKIVSTASWPFESPKHFIFMSGEFLVWDQLCPSFLVLFFFVLFLSYSASGYLDSGQLGFSQT